MADEPATDPIIGTREAAELLGWSHRKVQRQVKEWVDNSTAPIAISTVGARHEYVFLASDIDAFTAKSS